LFLGIYLSIVEFCDEKYLKSLQFNPNEPKRKPDLAEASGRKKTKADIDV